MHSRINFVGGGSLTGLGSRGSAPLRGPNAFGLLYYPGVRCPGCGSTGWHIGRSTAECPRCATALVIVQPVQTTLQGAN